MDPNAPQFVTVFGGSGFVGRHIVRALAKTGIRIRVAVRRPNEALFLKTAGRAGQIEIVQANIRDEKSCKTAIQGADVVINAVGILSESGSQRFMSLQAEGAGRLAKLAHKLKAKKFIHLSAIGADADSASIYAQSKAHGERLVQKAFKSAVILRPSIVVGPEDDFFNRFASLAGFAPALPLIGGGVAKFQPISVYDLATCVVEATIAQPAAGIYELGGPTIYSFKDLMELLLKEIDRPRLLVPMPFWAARIIATFAQFAPKPLITPDQLILLRSDNVVTHENTIDSFSVVPSPIEGILPTYLGRYQPNQSRISV